MANRKILIAEKFFLFLLLGGSIWGFWYFEPSLFLKILVVGLALVGMIWAFFKRSDKPQLASQREFLILLTLYLGLFSLYNLLYGLSIPLYLIMIAVLILTGGLFYGLLVLDSLNILMEKPIFQLLTVTIGLAVLEVFLSLSFWPIDPKIKTMVIVVIFYLLTSLIYLYIHNVLKLKRVLGYVLICVIVLAILFIVTWLKFLK